jgi:hypothetical protein
MSTGHCPPFLFPLYPIPHHQLEGWSPTAKVDCPFLQQRTLCLSLLMSFIAVDWQMKWSTEYFGFYLQWKCSRMSVEPL